MSTTAQHFHFIVTNLLGDGTLQEQYFVLLRIFLDTFPTTPQQLYRSSSLDDGFSFFGFSFRPDVALLKLCRIFLLGVVDEVSISVLPSWSLSLKGNFYCPLFLYFTLQYCFTLRQYSFTSLCDVPFSILPNFLVSYPFVPVYEPSIIIQELSSVSVRMVAIGERFPHPHPYHFSVWCLLEIPEDDPVS